MAESKGTVVTRNLVADYAASLRAPMPARRTGSS